MKKCSFLIMLVLISFSFCNSQIIPKSLPNITIGWERIYVKDVGNFDLPPSLEIQEGKYKKFVDEYRNLIGFEATQITAQQKGLNDLDPTDFQKYARVILETEYGKPNDYEKLDFNINEYSNSDIKDLNNDFLQQIRQNFDLASIKLIEWYPLKMEIINNMSCIHISYLRQLRENPYVFVNIYMFYNYDRVHVLTLSYRISETNYWKADFQKILYSFRITNIK